MNQIFWPSREMVEGVIRSMLPIRNNSPSIISMKMPRVMGSSAFSVKYDRILPKDEAPPEAAALEAMAELEEAAALDAAAEPEAAAALDAVAEPEATAALDAAAEPEEAAALDAAAEPEATAALEVMAEPEATAALEVMAELEAASAEPDESAEPAISIIPMSRGHKRPIITPFMK